MIEDNPINVTIYPGWVGGWSGGTIVINDTNFLWTLNATTNVATKNGTVVANPAIVSQTAPSPVDWYYIVGVAGTMNIDNIADVWINQTVAFRSGLWFAEANTTAHLSDFGNPHQTSYSNIWGIYTDDATLESAINLKANNQAGASSSTNVLMVEDTIYGSYLSPLTGNITINLTWSVRGVVATIIHNDTTEPTISNATNHSGAYEAGEINIIQVIYDGTTAFYIISN